MSRRDAVALVVKFAACVERACDATDNDRTFADLCDVIRVQEKEHRAFGRQIVGAPAVRAGRLGVSQAVSYFVARTIADALTWPERHGFGEGASLEDRPVSTLVGIREDYVRAAVLVADERVQKALGIELGEAFAADGVREVCARVLEADYAALVGGA